MRIVCAAIIFELLNVSLKDLPVIMKILVAVTFNYVVGFFYAQLTRFT